MVHALARGLRTGMHTVLSESGSDRVKNAGRPCCLPYFCGADPRPNATLVSLHVRKYCALLLRLREFLLGVLLWPITLTANPNPLGIGVRFPSAVLCDRGEVCFVVGDSLASDHCDAGCQEDIRIQKPSHQNGFVTRIT